LQGDAILTGFMNLFENLSINFSKTSYLFNLDKMTPIECMEKSLTNSSSVGTKSNSFETTSDFS